MAVSLGCAAVCKESLPPSDIIPSGRETGSRRCLCGHYLIVVVGYRSGRRGNEAMQPVSIVVVVRLEISKMTAEKTEKSRAFPHPRSFPLTSHHSQFEMHTPKKYWLIPNRANSHRRRCRLTKTNLISFAFEPLLRKAYQLLFNKHLLLLARSTRRRTAYISGSGWNCSSKRTKICCSLTRDTNLSCWRWIEPTSHFTPTAHLPTTNTLEISNQENPALDISLFLFKIHCF